jgi:hypothetical protein
MRSIFITIEQRLEIQPNKQYSMFFKLLSAEYVVDSHPSDEIDLFQAVAKLGVAVVVHTLLKVRENLGARSFAHRQYKREAKLQLERNGGIKLLRTINQ